MAKSYSYNLESPHIFVDYASAHDEGYYKDGDEFVKETKKGIERLPVIETTIEVYATARWTDGQMATVRVSIPIKYVVGFEDELAVQIEGTIESLIVNQGEGFERVESIEIESVEGLDRALVKVTKYWKEGKEIRAYYKTKSQRFSGEQEVWLREHKSISKSVLKKFVKVFNVKKTLNALRSKHSRL